MALIYTTTNITIATTASPTGLAHGLGATPTVVMITPRSATVTSVSMAALIASGTTTITVGCSAVAGLFDISAIVYHSIIQ